MCLKSFLIKTCNIKIHVEKKHEKNSLKKPIFFAKQCNYLCPFHFSFSEFYIFYLLWFVDQAVFFIFLTVFIFLLFFGSWPFIYRTIYLTILSYMYKCVSLKIGMSVKMYGSSVCLLLKVCLKSYNMQ